LESYIDEMGLADPKYINSRASGSRSKISNFEPSPRDNKQNTQKKKYPSTKDSIPKSQNNLPKQQQPELTNSDPRRQRMNSGADNEEELLKRLKNNYDKNSKHVFSNKNKLNVPKLA
jgi:hypothetical protein